ncbi:DeoR family transcriptional regulator [Spiroplasma clarkii]|uniref:DeoR family transcriptional regulator, fructose operon transcriptional repressor n=1 Tax=Spiroplasma clarkii TaxID=2139 RepID=A0A1Y0KZT8_9MOLU|nr:DeoR/GlpR family DNA-binding transcription regulator [Spiroplasma clarkii]ARU90979.1 DeoR family transcriptional regulator [Spiroplasma clarkii]ATX70421.1 DeoR family transcriptional regulator, fructose operon transcriptional repressor [Spiroplasma clarkii]
MLRDERRELIVKIVKEKGFVKNLTLAELTDSTIQTIITDVNELNDLGKIVKVYGGAKVIEKAKDFSEPFEEEKLKLNLDLKEKIARQAASQIQDGDLVFIDTGTTTGYMVKNVILNKNATYVTNGYSIARHLMEQDLKLYIIGGEIMLSTHAIVGELALKYISSFNFNKAFIGMNGYEDNALYTTNVKEAAIKEKVISSSKTTYVLLDSSKVNKKNKVQVDVNKNEVIIICDQPILNANLKVIEAK